MTKKDFLDIFNDIGDEFINEFANAAQNKRDDGDFSFEDFGSPQRPQIVRLERPPKKRISRVPFIAAFTAAAVLVCAVTAGALFKRKTPPPIAPNDSVTLSEPLSKPDPIIIEPKIERVEREGYDFTLKVEEGEWRSDHSESLLKDDNSDELAIYLDVRGGSKEFPISEEYPLSILFYKATDPDEHIASLKITSPDRQWHRVTYSEKPERGEKIVMQLCSKTMGSVVVRGRIIP